MKKKKVTKAGKKKSPAKKKKTSRKAIPAGPPGEIASRIESVGEVEWRKCKWLQPPDLKKQSKKQLEKLQRSLINNGFAAVFYVWKQGRTTWILDGHHRELAMKDLEKNGFEGSSVAIPDKLPAAFLRCRNRKEAIKLCLLYSSQYATTDKDVLLDFAADLHLDDLALEIDIPGIVFADTAQEKTDAGRKVYPIVVDCRSKREQVSLHERLSLEGFVCSRRRASADKGE